MAHAKTCWLLATALTLGSIGGIHAQGTADSAANPGNSAGGTRRLEPARGPVAVPYLNQSHPQLT